jgi:NAD+ synthase
MKSDVVSSNIINWIKDYCESNGIQSLVIGISGGVDSALTSTLSALTGLNTYLVSMPIHQNKDQLLRARNHVEWLCNRLDNVHFIEKDLTSAFSVFSSALDDGEKTDLSLANTRARLRMTMLYQLASVHGAIVVGTGNKVEDFGVGFYTKYGDGGVDISPIADLTKSEVRELSRYLGVDNEIVNAAPTDGLWEDDRTDEEQLGASYEELEWAMEYQTHQTGDLSDRQKEVVGIYKKYNEQNKHKMVPIPVFKVQR